MAERAPVTAENREIAQVAIRNFGGEPNVHPYWNEARSHSVDILSCAGSPGPGLTSFATLTLSNHPLKSVAGDLRCEMLAAARDADAEAIGRVLSGCALAVIAGGATVGPGAVISNILDAHGLDTTTPHLLFVDPFIWGDSFRTLHLPRRSVAWLQLLPITDAELETVKTGGFRPLLDRMEAARPDIFDLRRDSV